MSTDQRWTTIGQLPDGTDDESHVPVTLTRLAWALWVVSVLVFVGWVRRGADWAFAGAFVVDGLTVVMWLAVTFISGIVHSYSRRYMAGTRDVDRFFTRTFAFTVAVMALVAADNLVLFAGAWLTMGLVMADLIGHVRGWPQARAAGALARQYFLGGSAVLAAALATLWWQTGATTVSGVAAATDAASPVVLFAAGALVVAAMMQSALFPFHAWLLSSMTAPTPASALMHAGFVNAGGILLVRFAPVVTVEPTVMLAVVMLGATSALLGKLLKTTQTDIKRQLGCSTVGQMGFMLMQAGLGFFAAAITHLILHGFYKGYQFLASGERVAREHPTNAESAGRPGAVGLGVSVVTAVAGGVAFAVLTGEGTELGGGLLLTLLVVLTTLQAARNVVGVTSLPTWLRYGAVPAVFLPAIVVYAAVYHAVEGFLAGLPAVGSPTELSVVHAVVAAAFVLTYLAVETGVYRRSRRLYVALVNLSRPPSETLLTRTEEYNEY